MDHFSPHSVQSSMECQLENTLPKYIQDGAINVQSQNTEAFNQCQH